MLRKITLVLVFVALATLVTVPAFAGKGKVKIAYVEWDCAATSTNMVQAVLQEKMGYDVEIIPVAAAAMWQAVGTGDVDGMVTAWLPVTHADYYKKVADKVENLGPIVGGAKLGWAVPTYVEADSIEDLNKYADKFDGKIIGIDPGAGLMRLSEQAVKDYDLKLELMEGSGATMTAALADAVKNHKWVVVTAWSPHWMFGKWELKYLKDPKGVLGGEERIETTVRGGRMSKGQGFVAKLLNIKPVLTFNRQGKAEVVDKAIGNHLSDRCLMNQLRKYAKGRKNLRFAICHVSAPDKAERYRKMLWNEFGVEPQFIEEASPAVGCYSGLGAAAVAVLGD